MYGCEWFVVFLVLLLHLLCVCPLLYQTDRTDSGHFFVASLRSITVNGNRGWVVFFTLVWFVEPTLEGHSVPLPVRVKKVMAIFFSPSLACLNCTPLLFRFCQDAINERFFVWCLFELMYCIDRSSCVNICAEKSTQRQGVYVVKTVDQRGIDLCGIFQRRHGLAQTNGLMVLPRELFVRMLENDHDVCNGCCWYFAYGSKS